MVPAAFAGNDLSWPETAENLNAIHKRRPYLAKVGRADKASLPQHPSVLKDSWRVWPSRSVDGNLFDRRDCREVAASTFPAERWKNGKGENEWLTKKMNLLKK